MSIEVLCAQNYYDDFERSGWDLGTMHNILEDTPLPPEIVGGLREQEDAHFLILGSATPQNLDKIALIDKILRPGRGDRDKALIIDYHMYPLQRHLKKIHFLHEWEANQDNQPPDEARKKLLYPRFVLAQADIKQLPCQTESVDVAISDYTYNFLPSIDAVAGAFAETARAMRMGGLLLLAVSGNEKYHDLADQHARFDDAQQHTMSGNVTLTKYPLATYFDLAERQGLVLKSGQPQGNNLMCGILQKSQPTK